MHIIHRDEDGKVKSTEEKTMFNLILSYGWQAFPLLLID